MLNLLAIAFLQANGALPPFQHTETVRATVDLGYGRSELPCFLSQEITYLNVKGIGPNYLRENPGPKIEEVPRIVVASSVLQ